LATRGSGLDKKLGQKIRWGKKNGMKRDRTGGKGGVQSADTDTRLQERGQSWGKQSKQVFQRKKNEKR